MNPVSPLNQLLLLLIFFGYIALSIWLIYQNKNQNKILWMLLILSIPFIGSTVYFINYLVHSDSKQSLLKE